MIEFIETHLLQLLTLLVQCGLFKFAYSVWADYKNLKASRDAAIRSLLRTQIINLCKKAEREGFIAVYNVENLNDMFMPYSVLGGNGAVKNLYEHALSLPHVHLDKGEED